MESQLRLSNNVALQIESVIRAIGERCSEKRKFFVCFKKMFEEMIFENLKTVNIVVSLEEG